MTGFDEREKAEENRFVHEEELLFKARARRNRIVGEWAAGKMGLSGRAAETYAQDLVSLDATDGKDVKVLAKLKADLAPHGVSEHQILRELAEQLPLAIAYIKKKT